MNKITRIKILSVRSPYGLKLGYDDIIGQVVELIGNAYTGFDIRLSNGERRSLVHYNYTYNIKHELLDDIVLFESEKGKKAHGYHRLERIREAVLLECDAGNLEYFAAADYLESEHGVIL